MKNQDDHRTQQLTALLQQAGIREKFHLVPLEGGANNKVFRVELPKGPLLYKEYFHHPDDTRNRLQSEYAFIHFAWRNGLRALPEPLAQGPAGHCALYEFIPGRKLTHDEITGERVNEALRFFQQVNEFKSQRQAGGLPQGSEACFTLHEHCHCVKRRIGRLQKIEPTEEIDEQAVSFIRNDLTGAWDQIREYVSLQTGRLGLSEVSPLAHGDRCLSPSDFGFHNALLTPVGTIKFIDFEYAGWDDPAKTVCDFFCQPEKPVPLDCFEAFARGVAEGLSAPAMHLVRFRTLLPVYQVKWCCIMLNDFLPTGASRRQFARGREGSQQRKLHQLAKARRALGMLQTISRAA